MSELSSHEKEALKGYLEDDLGRGDPTSSLFAPEEHGSAVIVCEEDCILSGLAPARYIFELLRATMRPAGEKGDGDPVARGTVIAEVRGHVPSLLAGERTALNILSRMSGTATAARKASELASLNGLSTRVAGTRKTTPGFALFEKRALMDGGALPHRSDLSSLAMVKDNHLMALGGGPGAVSRSVKVLRSLYGPYMPVEVEVTTTEEGLAAIESGADIVMLDNMGPDGVRDSSKAFREAMSLSGRKIALEASGGIALDDIPLYAPYVDIVSLGALTYGAPKISFKMEMAKGS